ncbi:MAG: hypothetical protein JXM71_00595 [Spirochaetales bacterium]|nr:hypothetical protein [Spirochaetales bacterium]
MRYASYVMDGFDPAEHLATESILLLESTDEAIVIFYRNSPSIIVGRNQNPWAEIAPGTIEPVYRRVSGGGTVYHDEGNLNWAFIVPRQAHDQFQELAMIARGVSDLGVNVRADNRGGLYCEYENGSGRGLVKVSGTARRVGSTMVLHHGTLLVNADLDRMRSCLGGLPTSADAGVPSVPATPANLADLVPGVCVADFVAALSTAISGGPPRALPPEFVDAELVRQETRRLSSTQWRYGTTPPFRLRLASKDLAAIFSVSAGIVEDISFEPANISAKPPQSTAARLRRLVGKPFPVDAGKGIEYLLMTLDDTRTDSTVRAPLMR